MKLQSLECFKGPIATRVVVKNFNEELKLTRQIVFYEDISRIDFVTELNWSGENSDLIVKFPLSIKGRFTTGIPYGFIPREEGRWLVIQWMDYGDQNYGVALLNCGLPDHNFAGSTIELTLLRAVAGQRGALSKGMDRPTFDSQEKGQHTFHYALYPHQNSWQEARVYQQAWQLNNPIIYHFTDIHQGILPREKGFLSCSDNIVVTVLMRNEKDEIICRFYEACGKKGTVRLAFNFPGIKELIQTNLLDEPVKLLSQNNIVELFINPQSIETFKIK